MAELKKYVPSNGTDGMVFVEQWCEKCIRGKYEHTGCASDNPCEILSQSFLSAPDPINEWVYGEDGKPKCTAFVKFDWIKDDEGNFIDPPPPPDPNQLQLNFGDAN